MATPQPHAVALVPGYLWIALGLLYPMQWTWCPRSPLCGSDTAVTGLTVVFWDASMAIHFLVLPLLITLPLLIYSTGLSHSGFVADFVLLCFGVGASSLRSTHGRLFSSWLCCHFSPCQASFMAAVLLFLDPLQDHFQDSTAKTMSQGVPYSRLH